MKHINLTVAHALGFFSILLALTLVTIHIPAQIYTANSGDFTFSLSSLLGVPLAPIAILTIVVSLPLLIPHKTLVRILAMSWFSVAVAIWISSSLLILNVGILDGRTEAIIIPPTFVITTAVVLVAAIVVGILFSRWSLKAAAFLVIFLNIGQAGASLIAIVNDRPKVNTFQRRELSTLFQMSKEKNVLIILMDTFQSSIFEKVLRDDPKLADSFDGFTFYRDTVGIAPTTYASLPAIHSGVPFDPDRPLTSIYKESVQSGSFMAGLAASGYEASQVNAIHGCPDGVTCLPDEMVMEDSRVSLTHEYLQLLDVSLLRAAPAHAKQWVFNGGAWIARGHLGLHSRAVRNHRFLSLFGEKLFVSGSRPSAKFLHLFTTHPPVELGKDCEILAKPPEMTSDTLAMPAACAVQGILRVLDKLKDLSLYDKSFVAIIADHGAGVTPSEASVEDGKVQGWNSMAGAATPLLLVKRQGDRGPLRISDDPAYISDLAATVCQSTGDCRSSAGIPLNQLPPSRPRSYFSYEWKNDFWDLPKLLGVKQFQIEGPAWKLSSWSRVRPPVVELGKGISFRKDFANHDQYLDWGWSGLEEWGVWSDGPAASLSFSLSKPIREPLGLRIEVPMIYVTADTPTLHLSATANGAPLGSWKFEFPTTTATLEATIMPDMWKPEGRMTVRMQFERPVGLDRVANAPSRMLGIGIESIRVERQGS